MILLFLLLSFFPFFFFAGRVPGFLLCGEPESRKEGGDSSRTVPVDVRVRWYVVHGNCTYGIHT